MKPIAHSASPAPLTRKSFFRGFGSVLNIHAMPPVRAYTVREAFEHDVRNFENNLYVALAEAVKELSPKQRNALKERVKRSSEEVEFKHLL